MLPVDPGGLAGTSARRRPAVGRRTFSRGSNRVHLFGHRISRLPSKVVPSSKEGLDLESCVIILSSIFLLLNLKSENNNDNNNSKLGFL